MSGELIYVEMIYLACPYSHIDPLVREQRFTSVNKAAAKLMGQGRYVFSPISHTHPIAKEGNLPLGWDYWERYDRIMINSCTRLIVLKLDGWETSTGVTAEIKIATELGLPVEYIEPEA